MRQELGEAGELLLARDAWCVIAASESSLAMTMEGTFFRVRRADALETRAESRSGLLASLTYSREALRKRV